MRGPSIGTCPVSGLSVHSSFARLKCRCETCVATMRAYYRARYHSHGKRWREKNTHHRTLQRARGRAKSRGVPFALKVQDLPDVPEFCPALGIKLERGKGKFQSASPSLDCMGPALGYVVGNVQWLSQKANTMKQDATPEQLRAFALWALQPRSQPIRGARK